MEGSESPSLKAGQTYASTFEAVKVSHALLMLEIFVCVESDVVTNLGYLFKPRFIYPSVEFPLICKTFGFCNSCMMCEYVGLTSCHLPIVGVTNFCVISLRF